MENIFESVGVISRSVYINKLIETTSNKCVHKYPVRREDEVKWYYGNLCKLLTQRFYDYYSNKDSFKSLEAAITSLCTHEIPLSLEKDFFENQGIRVYNSLKGASSVDIINATGIGTTVDMKAVGIGHRRRMKVPAYLLDHIKFSGTPVRLGMDPDKDLFCALSGMCDYVLSSYEEELALIEKFNREQGCCITEDNWFAIWFDYNLFGSSNKNKSDTGGSSDNSSDTTKVPGRHYVKNLEF